jgi:flap endonuclease GEN
MYNLDSIKSKLGLDRRKLIAFALLVGCDYVAKGVPGIGWKSACDWLQSLRDDPLSRCCRIEIVVFLVLCLVD